MELRGRRECKECGTTWSYYETGSVTCPSCESLRSVGLDELTEHTASPVSFDLTPVRTVIDDASIDEIAERASEIAAEYAHKAGFVHAGELQPIGRTYVAAVETKYVGRDLARRMRVDDDEQRYFLSLLADADEGDRPNPTEVPESLHGPRGLAVAATLEAYHRDVSRSDLDLSPESRDLLEQLRDHRKRVEALDGTVRPREAERLLDAMIDLSRFLTDGDEDALATARSRLDEAI